MIDKKILSEQLVVISSNLQPQANVMEGQAGKSLGSMDDVDIVNLLGAQPEYRIYTITNELGAILREKHFKELNDENI